MEKNKKVEMFKTGKSIVLGVGVSAIVGGAVKTVSDPKAGLLKTACVWVSTIVLCSMATDAVDKYADEKIDSFVGDVKKMIEDGELKMA